MQCLGGSPGHCTSQHWPAPALAQHGARPVPALAGAGARTRALPATSKDVRGRVNAYAWAEYTKLLQQGTHTPYGERWQAAIPRTITMIPATATATAPRSSAPDRAGCLRGLN